ncbi:MAG TPA: carboxylating nicotinate-nucleotide diphosphorylase [Bryobacteraceae bacterium]|jgi:nicotinate-nucleotide pyrophosphorylase (carboxylating)|nr:carboxylating nicotinate-nucleotide diphosphorylase [Bryobacteraceae bacterium]
MFDISHPDVRRAIQNALDEDIGGGDITTNACVPALKARAEFVAQQDLTLAGVELLALLFSDVSLARASGDRVAAGEKIAEARGAARDLLTRERVALNFLQRLSGIATLAAKFVLAVEGTGVRILDTRKTTPGLRVLEKMAAAAGGVVNHRMGLYEAVLIKNNHIRLAGGVRAAIEGARSLNRPIEIETRTHAEIEEALACGAARLLLDNMTPEQAANEIEFIGRRAETEISGGVTLENVRAYAEAGPDFISSGAITHSAAAVDINCGIYAF